MGLQNIELLMVGTYESKVDNKNRINIPSQLRKTMGNEKGEAQLCYVSGYGAYIPDSYVVYSLSNMLTIEPDAYQKFSLTKIDKQHRIILPGESLNGCIVKILGFGDHFRIQKLNKEQNQEK